MKDQTGPKQNAISLAFVRYRLLDWSGVELLQRIRELEGYGTLPVVLLTSPESDELPFSGKRPRERFTVVYEKLISPETFAEVEDILKYETEG